MAIAVTITWHPPTRPGFVSAWDATREDWDAKNIRSFASLTTDQQNAAVRAYVSR